MRHKFFLLIVLAIVIIAFSTPARAAPDAILVVNNASDKILGVCDASHCTLREAILASNATADVVDTIQFNIPNTSALCDAATHVCTIQAQTALPEITAPVVIDGYSQPGAQPNTLQVGNDAALKIVLDGSATTDAHGLDIQGGNSTIKGLVIVGFDEFGILVRTANDVIEGNWIGIAADGVTAQGNTLGMGISGHNHRIGGTTPAARNVVSGVQAVGILVEAASTISIQGNYIGTGAQGSTAIGNGVGILVAFGNHVTIGGTDKRARNVISSNLTAGITLNQTTNALVQNNFIGTDPTGKHPLGTQGIGIEISSGEATSESRNNIITRNRIAFHAENGIQVRLYSYNTFISRNTIHSNGGLGINLGTDGITFNDDAAALDADEGANHLQNFPVLSSAQSSGGTTTIQATLRAAAKQDYRIEFFSGACNGDSPFNYGEGKKYLGAVDVKTNAQGKATFTFTKNKPIAVNTAITATATDNLGNTSEFSKCKAVQ